MSSENFARRIFTRGIDARGIYVLVILALAFPLIFRISLPPAPMLAAEDVYKNINALQPQAGHIVVVAADWGPGTSAENEPQTRLVIEHLLRKRIPFALMSLYQLAAPMMKELPLSVIADLQKKDPSEHWEYGKDWVNLGYQVAGAQTLQSLSKSKDIQEVLKTDAFGVPLSEIPLMKDVRSLKDVQMLVHITGLVGVFNTWLQFFQADSYRPPMLHGCTSISIPDAYMYYASKQILGFFEGVAGAAWYDKLLDREYPDRTEVATGVNTGLAFAQIIILVLILLGNVSYFINKKLEASQSARK